jgi:4-amino-4-deoxy-L-arabinose transferase-like glycosyltransferase
VDSTTPMVVPSQDERPALPWYRLAALAVALAAFAFRFQGIWFGYPLPVHPDEHQLVERAWRMIWFKDLNPEFFIYPSLNIYLQAGVQVLVTLVLKALRGVQFSEIPLITFYLAGRITTVLMAAATAYVVFEIGRRLVHPLAGLVAALFLAVSFLHVSNSYYVTVDAPAAFFSALAALMAALVLARGPRFAYYLLGGVFAGLAMSSKYTAALAILPLVTAHAYQARRGHGWVNRDLSLALVAVPATLVLTSPYLVLDFPHFWADFQGISEHYRGGHADAEAAGARSWHLYGGMLWGEGYGVAPTLLAGLGLGWLLVRREWWKAALLASFPIALLAFVGAYKVYFARNVVPLVPFLAVLSGVGVFETAGWVGRRLQSRAPAQWVAAGVAALLVLGGVWSQAAHAQERIETVTRTDTRWLATRWVEEHVPAGACIAREGLTPPIEDHTDRYRVELLQSSNVFERLAGAGCPPEYLILSSFNYNRYLRNAQAYPEEASAYRSFFAAHQPLAEFVPNGKTTGGPVIRIYRLEGR